jgi:hypothetical protein
MKDALNFIFDVLIDDPNLGKEIPGHELMNKELGLLAFLAIRTAWRVLPGCGRDVIPAQVWDCICRFKKLGIVQHGVPISHNEV